MHQPVQLQLFEFLIQPEIKAIHDPYWDELEAQKEDIVEQAFLSINALDENLDIGVEVAPQQNIPVRAQISFDAPPYKSVRAQVDYDTAPEHNYPESSVNSYTSTSYTHWVEKYWVKRRGEKHDYYRYCWMEGRKKYRCHIAGRAGSIGANNRKEVVVYVVFTNSANNNYNLIRTKNIDDYWRFSNNGNGYFGTLLSAEAYDRSFEVVGAKWREEVIKNAKSIEEIHREGLLAALTQPKELKEIRNGLNNTNANVDEVKANSEKVKAVSEKAKVDLEKTKVDLEKTKVDLEKTKVDLEKTKVDLEKTKVDSGKTKVDLEKTKVDSGKTKVDLEKTKVDSGKTKVDLEKTKVDSGKTKVDLEKTKVDLEKTKVDSDKTKVDLEKTKVDSGKTKVDLENNKADIEKNKADLNKTNINVEKNKADSGKTKVDLELELEQTKLNQNKIGGTLEEINTKVKEQEKVNKDAIPKLDQILGFLPLIPARAAAAIRPDIPTIPQIEQAATTGTCRSLQPGGVWCQSFR